MVVLEGRVLHSVPGRMRLRFDSGKKKPRTLEAVRRGLHSLAGVRSISVNPLLGTLVLQYDPGLFAEFPERMRAYATEHRLFSLEGSVKSDLQTKPSATDRSLEQFFQGLNEWLLLATNNKIGLKELFPFGIAAYSFLFVDRAIAASQWLSWIQFALSTYLELHEDQSDPEMTQSIAALRAEIAALRVEIRELNAKNAKL
jgi:hypothetical protein